jgi:ABC-type Fe3+ transport system substrate-binding protein
MNLTQALLALVLAAVTSTAVAADRLVILSPHRKTIQEEHIPAFKAHYKQAYGTDVEVDWIDQGGTSNAVKYLAGKMAANPTAVGIDIFWGGTSANFVDMTRMDLLAPYALPTAVRANLPKEAAGVPLSDSKDRWHASCLSSFGVMFNKIALKLEKLPEPKTWADLADAKFLDQVSATDPRKSGTNSTMNMIVLDTEGWDKGWALLAKISGNTRRFTQSSSDPVRAVAVGDAAAAMVIDFYGLAQVWELGADKIGFVLPEGQTILDPDPVAVVKNAPNRKVAERFVDFSLSETAQKLWMLPVGAKGGPTRANLARLAVNPAAYKATEGQRLGIINPFEKQGFVKMDHEKAGEWREPLNELFGAVFVDGHEDLKKAWKRVVEDGLKPDAVAAFSAAPVSEKDLMAAAKKWDDDVYRNQKLNEWANAARARYRNIAEGKAAH